MFTSYFVNYDFGACSLLNNLGSFNFANDDYIYFDLINLFAYISKKTIP